MQQQVFYEKMTSMHDAIQAYHPYVDLAIRAITFATKHRRFYTVTEDDIACIDGKISPVFVSIKKAGLLRGCIGTTVTFEHSLADMIAYCASAAALEDPRFLPLEPEELPDIDVSVDLLGSFKKVDDLTMLDPKKYGILVESNGKQGLLLPDLEGIDNAKKQVAIAMEKAGILAGESTTIQRFCVTRYTSKNTD